MNKCFTYTQPLTSKHLQTQEWKEIITKRLQSIFQTSTKVYLQNEALRRLREIRKFRERSLLEREDIFAWMMCLEV